MVYVMFIFHLTKKLPNPFQNHLSVIIQGKKNTKKDLVQCYHAERFSTYIPTFYKAIRKENSNLGQV